MGFERIDNLLNAVTADGSLHGIAATVVGRDGVLYEGAAGDARPARQERRTGPRAGPVLLFSWAPGIGIAAFKRGNLAGHVDLR